MLTEYEVQMLQKSMRNELMAPRGVVLKCVIWLILLHIGLAWNDAPTKVGASRDSPLSDTQATANGKRSSRIVFEERRQHYIDAHPDSRVAREPVAQRQKNE
jgi:hypothetical protein